MDPQYEEQFTAFVDFLGFSEASSKIDDSTRLKVLDLLLSISRLRGEFDVKSTPQESGMIHNIQPAMSTFSDHIVISYPLNPILASTGSERFAAFFVLHHFQHLLTSIAAAALRIGFLVRGGATIGKLYHSQGVVFGEAMIEAFQLESRTSVYPRVVLSTKITSHPTWGTIPQIGISKDVDGLYHVDYFTMLLSKSAPPGPDHNAGVKAWFADVVAIISKNLVELERAGKLNELAKWAWFSHQFKSGLEKPPTQLLGELGLSVDAIPQLK
jgi:hypothetical protein